MDNATVRRIRIASPLPFIAWAVLACVQIVSPDPAWSWLLAGLGALIILSYIYARTLRDHVSAQRQAFGTWVVAGDQLREQFTLTNTGRLPVLWARVRDGSDVPGYRVDRVETVGAQDVRRWNMAGVCRRRGVFRLGPWSLELADPAGLFRVEQTYPVVTTLMVYPRASLQPPIEMPRGRAPGRAASSLPSGVETLLVGGIRPYAPGDPPRHIHWRTTARHSAARQGGLMVREFDREPSGDLWLILDLDAAVQAGQDAEATHEYAVILAASLATGYLRQGERRAVGLLASGHEPILLPPGRGQDQLWRILQALAEADPAAGTSLRALLEQTGSGLGSGRTLVVITPSQDPGWVAPLLPLMARGNAPTAVLLDATTFSPPVGDPLALLGLRALLAQQRIPSAVLAQGFPFHPVELIRRRRQELRTLPGTGRVIPVDVEEEV